MEQTMSSQSIDLVFTALNISQARANLAQILAALEHCNSLTLDLSACEDVDTAGLQLLAAIRLDPEFQSRVRWKAPTEDFLTRAQRLGLSELLSTEGRD